MYLWQRGGYWGPDEGAGRNKTCPSLRKSTDKKEQKDKPMWNSRSRTGVPKDDSGSRSNLKRKLSPSSSANVKGKRNGWSVTDNSDTCEEQIRTKAFARTAFCSLLSERAEVCSTSKDEGKSVQNLTQQKKQDNNNSLKSFESQSNAPDNKQELSSKIDKEKAKKMQEKTEDVKDLPSPAGNDIDTCGSTCEYSRASTGTSTESQYQGSCMDEQLAEKLKSKTVQSSV
jgi:hypothetical protein